ncbi:hypothetical protein CPC16_000472 [Podila verticillata]|nr:hypothetical protein CPC16_000472 [Podila verticillata]
MTNSTTKTFNTIKRPIAEDSHPSSPSLSSTSTVPPSFSFSPPRPSSHEHNIEHNHRTLPLPMTSSTYPSIPRFAPAPNRMSGNYTPGTSTPRRSGTSSASSSPPGTPPSGLRSHYLNAAFQRSQHQFYSMGSAPGSTTSFHQTVQTPQQTSQRPNISILVPPTTTRIQIPEPAASQRSYSADHLRVDEPEITITSPGGSNLTEHHATTLQRALSNLIEKENRLEEEDEDEEDGPIVMKHSKTPSGSSSSSTPPGTPPHKKKGVTKFPKVVVDRLDPEKAGATSGNNHSLSQSRNSAAGSSDTTLAELNEKEEPLMTEKKPAKITIGATPVPVRAPAADLTRQPSKAGVLSNLLKLQNIGRQHKASSSKPRKEKKQEKKQKQPAMYSRSSNNSTASLTKKSVFGTYPPLPATTPTQSTFAPGTMTNFHPSTSRSNSSGNIHNNNHRNSIQFESYFGALSAAPSPMHSPTLSPRGSFSGGEEQLRITMAVADILERQDYILRLAKSMIKYGSPSHRLEDAIDHSARHLELNLQCVYLPNVMIVAFTDYETHTSETHLLKVHKMVTHESMPVEEAIMKLEAINSERDANPRWATILAYATSGLCTAPMFFNGSWIDAGVGFLLGGAVGLMVWLAEKVPSYARICEITMSVVVAFVAEALHGYVDCGTAIKLAGIVIILPGYTITCAILELSSRHIISGSVRLFYAVVFSLLLGYGLSIGASLWHLFDPSSNSGSTGSSTACTPSLDPKWNIMFVPLFAISLNIWLKAHPRQWLLATVLSIVGYAVSYTSSVYGGAKTEVSSALAAFAIGFCGNVYQRVTRQLSFQAVVCAVFFLVPGSIGLRGAIAWFSDDISTGVNFALQMVVTAIAISVGLFASALVVYPMGKARSAQMTF